MYVEGLVLAGGASRRMGQNKLALPVQRNTSETILHHVIDAVTQVASHVSVLVPPDSNLRLIRPRDGRRASVSTVPDSDLTSFHGPLQALAAAWPDEGETELVVVAAGDLPGLPTDVLKACIDRYHEWMSRPDADNRLLDGVLVQRNKVMQPLLGVYRAEAGQHLKDAVKTGEQRLMRAVAGLKLDLIDADRSGWKDWWTRPVHTPEDYQGWLDDVSGDSLKE